MEFRYRVAPSDRPEFLLLLAQFRDYVFDVGLAGFQVWSDEDDPAQIVEWHAYDSWSHFQRVSQKETPDDVMRLYAKMDKYVEGGLKSVTSRQYTPWTLPQS